jgi:hypothetical protein
MKMLALLLLNATLLGAGESSDSLKVEIIEKLDKYVHLSEELKAVEMSTGSESAAYLELREELNQFTKDEYVSALRRGKDVVVANSDSEILAAIIRAVLAAHGSKDDYRAFAMGEIFLSQPSAVEDAFLRLDLGLQRSLFTVLEDGFVKVSFRDKGIKNYDALKKRLEALGASIIDQPAQKK